MKLYEPVPIAELDDESSANALILPSGVCTLTDRIILKLNSI